MYTYALENNTWNVYYKILYVWPLSTFSFSDFPFHMVLYAPTTSSLLKLNWINTVHKNIHSSINICLGCFPHSTLGNKHSSKYPCTWMVCFLTAGTQRLSCRVVPSITNTPYKVPMQFILVCEDLCCYFWFYLRFQPFKH